MLEVSVQRLRACAYSSWVQLYMLEWVGLWAVNLNAAMKNVL